jgi:hypothetical protein
MPALHSPTDTSARVRDRDASTQPAVWLGHTAPDSIAVSIYVLVRDGARRHPQAAARMRASVRIRFADDGYPPVRIAFRGSEIEVADDRDESAACDLELNGRLGDIAALIAAPLAVGLPNPAMSAGRRALLRLADGRVELAGPLAIALDLLRLLAVDARRAPARRLRSPRAAGTRSRSLRLFWRPHASKLDGRGPGSAGAMPRSDWAADRGWTDGPDDDAVAGASQRRGGARSGRALR